MLVTGATGNIGRAVVAHLHGRGDRVIAVDTRPGDESPPDGVVAVRADCGDERAVEDAFAAAGPEGAVDQVVHLAAIANQEFGTPIEVFCTNVVATFTVMAVAARRKVSRAVIASSVQATGLPGHHLPVLPDRYPIDERQSAHLDDAYSLSKHTDEHTAAMAASRWGLPVVALRFPAVLPLAGLEHAARAYTGNPERAAREGWAYLEDTEAARAVACALDADTTGAQVMYLAAPDTLVTGDTEEMLDRYAPDVPRLRRFTGREVPVDTSRARELIGFTARSAPIQFLAGDSPTLTP